MRIVPVLAMLILSIAPAAGQERRTIPRPAACKAPETIVDDSGGGATRSRKLGELPPANQYRAVWNLVNGCSEPIVVQQGIGGQRGR